MDHCSFSLTCLDAAVLQVVDVLGVPEGPRLCPPGLSAEGAIQRRVVVLGRPAAERLLAEAELLAIASGNQSHGIDLSNYLAVGASDGRHEKIQKS